MSYEKAQGYDIIFRNAGFRTVEFSSQSMTFISTDEEEWWRQMQHLGWGAFIDRIEVDELKMIKEAIFKDLQLYKRTDGIHFRKTVLFVCGVK
jgi:hypothetical protein